MAREDYDKKICLSLRRGTTTIQKDPANLIDKLGSYVLHVRRLSRKFKFTADSIIAMDEAAVWADMVSSTTLERRGQKFKPFIVFGAAKRECKALHGEFKNKCVLIVSSKNAWMNEELTMQYIDSVIGIFSFNRRLLAWDSFQCHIMDSVKSSLSKSKIESVIIPGGYTKYIQALDVSWNKPFKNHVTDLYNEWLCNG